jgi:hypothetical protein
LKRAGCWLVALPLWWTGLVSERPVAGCGIYFPNRLLVGGDTPLLGAPEAGFHAELLRMHLVEADFTARLPAGSAAKQTAETDLADLRAALGGGAGHEEILACYEAARGAVLAHAESLASLNAPAGLASVMFQAPPVPSGLPPEFELYFRGALAWHSDKTNQARAAWQSLLRLPQAARPYRATWAAFMLGRSYAETERPRAVQYYQRVRELARAGFVDSLGLAAASVGWEAKAEYELGHYERAMDLYLEQLASGDESALISLRWVAADALRERVRSLRSLAAHPRARRVLTAFIISGSYRGGPVDIDNPVREVAANALTAATFLPAPAKGWHQQENPAVVWLQALEAVNAENVESAEQVALAAYQCGDFAASQRWIHRCSSAPVARWLQAKLWLREGRLNDAAAQLALLTWEFQVSPPPRAQATDTRLADHLVIDGRSGWQVVTPAEQVLGELGALRLARREYEEALDCLLRSGFWVDAAYVAERVLTTDELIRFVDRRRPQVAGVEAGRIREEDLRWLLARRLARSGRLEEAEAYFPSEVHPAFQCYLGLWRAAHATNAPRTERAAAWWGTALLIREEGMRLFGTEVEPDWACWSGAFDLGGTLRQRVAAPAFARPSREEVKRAMKHAPDPEARYHYRYRAAALAWEAATLMPNNSDDTARVLCTAGSWLKHRDPKAADVFYKALVRRCRRTALGQAADRKRWFPELDSTGNLAVKKSEPALVPADGD